MTESVERWWARRRRSKSTDVPYPIGTFRADWQQFSVLVRQYHPELNTGITLTQIPPAADVYLLWECDAGHRFVATPTEQRERPGRTRRRSTWCPECSVAVRGGVRAPRVTAPEEASAPRTPVPVESRRATRRRGTNPARADTKTEPSHSQMAPGDAWWSARAPKPASAAEADLRRRLQARLNLDLQPNAVRVRRAFHDRFEVWPDIVIPDLKVALEYDTTGKSGTEHVGERERSDRLKDRLLRHVGWEVIRIRCSRLAPIGPFDISASGVSAALIDRIIEQLRHIRGDLIVDAYCVRGPLEPEPPAIPAPPTAALGRSHS